MANEQIQSQQLVINRKVNSMGEPMNKAHYDSGVASYSFNMTGYPSYAYTYTQQSNEAVEIQNGGAKHYLNDVWVSTDPTVVITGISPGYQGWAIVNLWGMSSSSGSGGNQSQVTLTASSVSMASSVTTGNALRIMFSNSNPTYVRHNITYTFNNSSQTINVPVNTAYYDLDIPHSWFSDLNTTNNAPINISVTTINNSTGNAIGAASTGSATVYLAQTSDTIPAWDTNYSANWTKTRTGNSWNYSDKTVFAQSISGIQLVFGGATGKQNAAIDHYELSGDLSGSTDSTGKIAFPTLSKNGTYEYSVVAVDKRGFRSEAKNDSFFVYEYVNPIINTISSDCQRCTWSATENKVSGNALTDDGKFCYLAVPVTYTALNINNANRNSIASVVIRYKASTDTQYSSSTLTLTIGTGQNANTYYGTFTRNASGNLINASSMSETDYNTIQNNANAGFDGDTSYVIQITCTDACGQSSTAEIPLGSTPYTMHLKQNGNGVAFGMAAQRDNAVEISPYWKLWLGDTYVDANKFMPDLPSTSAGQFLKDTGEWASLPAMSTNVAGLVPAPTSGDSGKFLRGDGRWAAITSSSGFSSWTNAEKQQLYDFIYPVGTVYTCIAGYATQGTWSLQPPKPDGITATWVGTDGQDWNAGLAQGTAPFYSRMNTWLRTA